MTNSFVVNFAPAIALLTTNSQSSTGLRLSKANGFVNLTGLTKKRWNMIRETCDRQNFKTIVFYVRDKTCGSSDH